MISEEGAIALALCAVGTVLIAVTEAFPILGCAWNLNNYLYLEDQQDQDGSRLRCCPGKEVVCCSGVWRGLCLWVGG